MPTDEEYARRSAEVATRIAETERAKSPDQRRLEEARRDAARFQYLEEVELGEAATRRRFAHERYIG
ncbi:MAG: hypothetical protein AAB455_02605 [Patescibacteria group bacterium]